ncbi:MAG: tetratricopeptide repeat protein [Saprospiraceae bacterium]|nr:tetratricopeptide repeat protein [Saprospiraceae bacterium]MBK7371082.1 tetratricopeptide repeat protein [Saprospiraceae bacterium]MBK7436417.1 tetratricopeptide repeat protein [Saprospiraceae bacterium]MBK8281154.1 tetratricopeptide repeat protein [Saprospiraceae bacterium]MBK8777136.1 tetratricopeptide repeat protein [Saprospiraceae bacterium]
MKSPLILLLISIASFFLLYFGFSKISPEIRFPEKSGTTNSFDTTFDTDLSKWKDSLSESNHQYVDLLEQQIAQATDDSIQRTLLEQLSGFWYNQGRVSMSAEYAYLIAEKFPTSDRWALAATNFIIAAKQPEVDPGDLTKWVEKAKHGFSQAIALDPDNVSLQLNQALINVEFPSEGSPMNGILELRRLNETYPDNTLVIYHLARLSIQTNQWDRAKERLQALIKLDPGFVRAYCLMAQVAQHDGDQLAFENWSKKCVEK